MFRFVFGLILAASISFPATATSIRVEVTGWATGGVSVNDVEDALTYEPVHLDFDPTDFGEKSAAMMALAAPDLLEPVTSVKGSLLFSLDDQTFSKCSGLLKTACWFNMKSRDAWFVEAPVFDIALDTFGFSAGYFCCRGIDVTPVLLFYGDDRHTFFTFEGISYHRADPVINVTFDTMKVTLVPGPAALPLLLSAFGAFVALKRRRT
jgi:hypothetical protein